MLKQSASMDEISHRISQLESLLLSKEDIDGIRKIMSLSELVRNGFVKTLIAEDLHDGRWIEDTEILIGTCVRRMEKYEEIKKSLSWHKGLLAFKMLDERVRKSELEFFFNEGDLNINESRRDGTKVKVASKRLGDALRGCGADLLIGEEAKKSGSLKVDGKWLASNKGFFFEEEISSEKANAFRAR